MSRKASGSRSRAPKKIGWSSPAPAQIRKLRGELTQEAAGARVKVARRTWQDWEAGARKMPPGLWDLALLRFQ